jgi:hypothetical protein
MSKTAPVTWTGLDEIVEEEPYPFLDATGKEFDTDSVLAYWRHSVFVIFVVEEIRLDPSTNKWTLDSLDCRTSGTSHEPTPGLFKLEATAEEFLNRKF